MLPSLGENSQYPRKKAQVPRDPSFAKLFALPLFSITYNHQIL